MSDPEGRLSPEVRREERRRLENRRRVYAGAVVLIVLGVAASGAVWIATGSSLFWIPLAVGAVLAVLGALLYPVLVAWVDRLVADASAWEDAHRHT